MNVFGYLQDGTNWSGSNGILRLLLQHLASTAVALLLAAVVAVPLGLLVGHTRRGGAFVTGLSHAARAIPSLGLLFLAVMLLGTGTGRVVVVLAILALPIILTAVATGVAKVDREAVHSGRALGMTEAQLLRRVEWPLALPVVLSGMRSATVQVVAFATVAAFASGGGLGRLLVTGQERGDYPQMFAGAVMIAGLALTLHLLLEGAGRLATRRARPSSSAPATLMAAPASW